MLCHNCAYLLPLHAIFRGLLGLTGWTVDALGRLIWRRALLTNLRGLLLALLTRCRLASRSTVLFGVENIDLVLELEILSLIGPRLLLGDFCWFSDVFTPIFSKILLRD